MNKYLIINADDFGLHTLINQGIIKEINFQGIRKLYLGLEAQKYLNILGYYDVSACNKLFKKLKLLILVLSIYNSSNVLIFNSALSIIFE